MHTEGLYVQLMSPGQPIVFFESHNCYESSISITIISFYNRRATWISSILGIWCSYEIMNGTVYSGPLQSDADILNQLSSHTVLVLSCASSVMNLIAA